MFEALFGDAKNHHDLDDGFLAAPTPPQPPNVVDEPRRCGVDNHSQIAIERLELGSAKSLLRKQDKVIDRAGHIETFSDHFAAVCFGRKHPDDNKP